MDSNTQSNHFVDLEFDLEVFQGAISSGSFSFSDALSSPRADTERAPTAYPTLDQNTFEFSTANSAEKASDLPLDNFIVFCGRYLGENGGSSELMAAAINDPGPKKITNGTSKTRIYTSEKSKVIASPGRSGNKTIRRYSMMKTSRNVLIGFGCNVAPTRMEISDIKERQMKRSAAGDSPTRSISNSMDDERLGKDRLSLSKTIGFKAYLSMALNKLSPTCFLTPAVSF